MIKKREEKKELEGRKEKCRGKGKKKCLSGSISLYHMLITFAMNLKCGIMICKSKHL